MKQGNSWRLDFHLGEMRIKKFKHTFLRDAIAIQGSDGSKTFKKRSKTPDDFFLAVRWHRKSIHVKLKYNWIVNLSRSVMRDCYKRIENDYTYIYKYQDT